MNESWLGNHGSLDPFRTLRAVCFLLAFTTGALSQTSSPLVTSGPANGPFEIKLDAGAIVSLRHAQDRVDTEYIQTGRRLGDVFIRYRGKDAAWVSADTAQLAQSGAGTFTPSADGRSYAATYQVLYAPPGSNSGPTTARATPTPVFALRVQYTFEEQAVVWTLTVQNLGNGPRQIDDLAIPLPIAAFAPRGNNQPVITILKHSFVSGYNSYMFWMRSNNVDPYLVLTPLENTKFEYWDVQRPVDLAQAGSAGRGTYRVYIHSSAAGTEAKAQGTRWRQPNTNLKLAPKGQPDDSVSYGFKLHWADDYDAVRQLLVDEGLVDVHVVPGMSLPSDLSARLALRTKQPIQAVEAEFAQETKIESLGAKGDLHFYQVQFSKLGENRLTIRYGKNQYMFLEFFSTEPLETLIMYRVAKNYPQIKTALPATEYLRRAYGTAVALFTVPMQIEGWSAYRTGLYNELVIVDLIADLQAAGMTKEAETLKGHWEQKVKTFVNGQPNLFQSEYAFDSTGFESTHALARYALAHADKAGENKTGISLENAERFMQTQLASNIFCRGWLEPAYYYLGSDYRGGGGNSFTLSYRSQMGGSSVLDYALNYAPRADWYLRLGYASYLSAWALMNSGTPESNYGYWYPGKENEGGAGGGFEPAPYGQTWLNQPHHRGPWYYASEVDLGYSGALRTAATILADDPVFGRFCFGGDWRKTAAGLEVIPKDGVRRRFHALLGAGEQNKLHMVLETDRFAASQPILLKEDFSEVRFRLESDNPSSHVARLRLSGLAAGSYALLDGSKTIAAVDVKDGQESVVEFPLAAGSRTKSFTISHHPVPNR